MRESRLRQVEVEVVEAEGGELRGKEEEEEEGVHAGGFSGSALRRRGLGRERW